MSLKTNLLPLTVCFCLFTTTAIVQAQDKDLQAKGEIKLTQHKVEMKAGELYIVKVAGNGFMPNAFINPGFLRQKITPFVFGQDNLQNRPFEAVFSPQQTQEHTITVLPNLFGQLPEGPLQYELTVKRMSFSKTPTLEKKEELTADDPKLNLQGVFNKGHHKSYMVNMKAGHTYVIEMIRKENESRMRDPYLLLLDAAMKTVSQDDDGAGDLNSRIIYEPQKAGEYRVIATTLGDNDVGTFTLTVRESVKD